MAPAPGTTTTRPTEAATVERLSKAFHRCFADLDVPGDLFTPDAFFDLLPPLWRFQLVGPQAFADQLRAVADGPAEIRILRTVPTTGGFVTEHLETQHSPAGDLTARRLHLCEVREGRIAAVTTYCNGGWDESLRARHATEAPMLRA